jgi:hypothetical protein
MKKEEDKHVSDAELFALLEKIGAKEIKYPPGTYIIMPWRRMKKEENVGVYWSDLNEKAGKSKLQIQGIRLGAGLKLSRLANNLVICW